MRISRPMRVVLQACAALAVLLSGSGCTPGPTVYQPTPTPFTYPTPLPTPTTGPLPPAVNGVLAPLPTDCLATPPPATFTLPADFGGGFVGDFTFAGSSPVWALGPGAMLRIDQTGEGNQTQPYPSAKVMWIVGPNYFQPVTLSGRELRTNASLWFEVYPRYGETSRYTTQAVLDPGAPNRGSATPRSGRWNIWGIGILVLAAGCYELTVTWPGGSWRTVFAAGS